MYTMWYTRTMNNTNTTVTVNGKAYLVEGTITMSPKVRGINGQVLWVSLRGERGAHYTLACYENNTAALYAGIFGRKLAINPEVH